MFMGEYSHSIDAKGRLIMPAKFREQLGDEFIVTKSPDKCLYIYSNDDWRVFEEKLATLPITNKETRQFVRFSLRERQTVRWTSREGFFFQQCSGSMPGLTRRSYWPELPRKSRFGIRTDT